MLTGPPSNPGGQVALRTVYKQGTQSSKKEMTCPRSLSREAGSWARALTSQLALCLASGDNPKLAGLGAREREPMSVHGLQAQATSAPSIM